MPYEIRFEKWAERVRVLGTGPSHYEETEKAVRGLAADPRFVPRYGVLVDTRALEYVPSLEDARRYQELFSELRASFRGRIAVVVQGAARYGVAQMIATLLEMKDVQMAAFKDPSAAEAWLGEGTPSSREG